MKFLKQVKTETKNIMTSKFLLILVLLALLFCIAWPVLRALGAAPSNDMIGMYGIRSKMISEDYYYGQEPITVDGVTIDPENPFYWQLYSLNDEMQNVDMMEYNHEQTAMILRDMMQAEQKYYLRFAQYVKSYEDYRSQLGWLGSNAMIEKFILEQAQYRDIEALKEALNYRYGYDPLTFDSKYVNITAVQRLAAIDAAETKLEQLYDVVESNDFKKFIDFRIAQEKENIANYESLIDLKWVAIEDLQRQKNEAAAALDAIPKRDEYSSQINEQLRKIDFIQKQLDNADLEIKNLKTQIEYITDNAIPILEYRLEKNIIPGSGSWQDQAIYDMENAQGSLTYTKPVSEEEFYKDQGLVIQYRTYSAYKAKIDEQIDFYQNMLLVARNSIETDKPDMKYAPEGARSQTLGFLLFGTIVGLLGIVIGGWMMASEFQLGTIRLLVIRPRTRTKILMSKFAAGLAVCLGLYFAGILLNLLMNGICFGFADYAFPNYSVSGQTGFFAYYLPKMLACAVPVIFAYCAAFMLSTVVKNMAVSISVPAILFVACVIVMAVLASRTGGYVPMPVDYWPPDTTERISQFFWLAWTPVPYVHLSDFFLANSGTQQLISSGMPINLGFGLPLFGVLSAAFTFISAWVFKKQDITN